MNRKELYAKVNELKLQDAIKAKYGKNFTQVSNSELEAMIKATEKKAAKKEEAKPEPKKEVAPKKETTKAEAKPKMSGTVESMFAKMVEILGKKRILLPSEVEAIANA